LLDASGEPETLHREVVAAVEKRLGVALAPHTSPLPAKGEREGPAPAGG
jgi:hypothetical protein